MAKPKSAASSRKTDEAVSRSEFDELKGLMKTVAEAVVELKKAPRTESSAGAAPQPAEPTDAEVKDADPNENPVNPHWRRLVDEVLGPDFGIEVYYPKDGGCHFTIIVPKDKSNAGDAHWANFKQDRRTREIGHTGIDGVKKWAELVKKNLAKSKSESIS